MIEHLWWNGGKICWRENVKHSKLDSLDVSNAGVLNQFPKGRVAAGFSLNQGTVHQYTG